MDAFDPTSARARLLGDDCGLRFDLQMAQEHAVSADYNLYFWAHRHREIALAYFVGLADHEIVQQLRALTLEHLRPERWAVHRAAARTSDELYNIASAWTGLALTRWLDGGERQPELFSHAHQAHARYFEAAYGKKSKWPVDSTGDRVTYACAAGDHAAVRALFARPQLAAHAGRTPAKVRTPLDLGQAIAGGAASPAELAEAADRMLRHQLGDELEGGRYCGGAQILYLASLVRPPVDVRQLFVDSLQNIRYLASKPKPATKSAAKPKPKPAPPPAPSHPLPKIGISSTVLEPWPPTPRWQQLADGRWAVRILHGGCQSIAMDRRLPDVVELHVHEARYARAQGLTRMTRATVDGEILSSLAARPEPSPLEVMFPLSSPNSADGAHYQISPPLTRGHWRDALAVGALVNLRAVTFDAAENPKQRVARGAAVYEVGPAWFWQSRLAQQLEALDVQADVHPLGVWTQRFAELPRLQRVYLRLWIQHTSDRFPRAVRFVIDRADGRLAWTLQHRSSPLDMPEPVLAALFAGMTPDDIHLDVEALRQPIRHEAELAAHLGRFARVRELRGDAALREL